MNLQHYGKTEALKKTEEKIAALEQELDEIPVVQEFKQSQVDVNDLLQLVASTISNTVTDEIIKIHWWKFIKWRNRLEIKNKDCSLITTIIEKK